ncbi:MAG: penicillin-binding protein [Actinomycetota bacterium]|nr:penicillin-binding protein [Actinomycetota bacterium]
MLLGTAVFVLVVGAVPPFRRAAAMASSRAVLWLASPLTPIVPDFDALPVTTAVLAADGSVIAELSGEDGRRAVLDISDVPVHVRQAVLAAEDSRFYEHSGTDPEAVGRAIVHTLLGRSQGGSTITQQLAKLNYTAGERTLIRKVREVLFSSALEQRYTKDKLLERYLNQVYFGNGAYGIRAGAQTFFGVEPAQLTPAQAATLAGKIRAPSYLNPHKRPETVIGRRDEVLDAMAAQRWLTDEALAQAKAEPLLLAPPHPPGVSLAPHFVDHVKREAATLEALGPDRKTRLTRLFTGGFSIQTTLDPKLFAATQATVGEQLGLPGDPITAVASVAPGDGAIRNLFGGLDFASTQFPYATRGTRQAGSAFKPFVYMAALRDEIDPRSTFDGTSGRRIGCYGDRPVRNYAGEDAGGRIDVDTALVLSVNVVFVELGCEVGVGDVVRAATDAGIPEDATEKQGAVFLGGLDRGVSALHMANAYATIAAVRDSTGADIYVHQRKVRRVFDEAQVAVLNRALARVVGSGTGRAAGFGRPVAGKTGTTQDNVDAWFVGYVPQLSTAVWVGYDPARPMADVHGRAVTGGSFPAAIFGQLMRDGLQGVPVRRLPVAGPESLGLRILNPPPPPPTTTTTLPVDSTTTTIPALTPPPPGQDPPSSTTLTTEEPETTTTTRRRKDSPAPTTTTTRPPPTTTTTRPAPTTATTASTAMPSTTTTAMKGG